MSYYYDFDNFNVKDSSKRATIVKRTASNLLELRAELDREIPPRTLYDTLLIATWNIRWFGKTERTDESLWYITEILSRFDLIAIQEVKRDLRHLDQVRDLLGPWWRYIVTDASEGSGDLPPRVVPHPMLVPAPVEGREGRASSGTRATA